MHGSDASDRARGGGPPSPPARPRRAPHRVAVLAYEGLAPFELGVVTEVFALPRPELDVPWWYELAVCAERPGALAAVGGITLTVEHGLDVLAAADTVIVPGCADPDAPASPALLSALQAARGRGARLVSICSGAFTLAATGLLDGREAATHWRYAEALQRRFPAVRVNAGVLYVDGEDVLTSAGSAAGIDLCLHLVRRDHGAGVANRVARRMVVAPHRDGGQAQFIERPVPAGPEGDPIARVQEWAVARLDRPLTVPDLAREAFMSPRTFTRRFTDVTGMSPGRWLIEQRVAASLELLERSDHPVEHVGALVGFASPAGFRRHFARALRISPSAYRKRFRASSA